MDAHRLCRFPFDIIEQRGNGCAIPIFITFKAEHVSGYLIIQVIYHSRDVRLPSRDIARDVWRAIRGKPQHWFQICAIELNELLSEPGSIPDWQEIVSRILGIKINMGIP